MIYIKQYDLRFPCYNHLVYEITALLIIKVASYILHKSSIVYQNLTMPFIIATRTFYFRFYIWYCRFFFCLLLQTQFVAHHQRFAGSNPNAARPAGDPWLDGRDIPDHWDAESAA